MGLKVLMLVLLAGLTWVMAQVMAPTTGTVWTNGETGEIAWGNIQGPSFTLVLYRINSQFHHTITSTASNNGRFSWPVHIPGQDGWPASSVNDLVYEIDFYVGGGWNNGGTLVAKSSPFAIIWEESSSLVTVITPNVVTVNPNVVTLTPYVVTITPTPVDQNWITTLKTEVIVGIFTTTVVVAEVITAPPQVVTVTNTEQWSTITQFPGVTTVGRSQGVLYLSGGEKVQGSATAVVGLVGVLVGFVFAEIWSSF
jgi:hypothetical protein